jgi:hypothetical protein
MWAENFNLENIIDNDGVDLDNIVNTPAEIIDGLA